MRPTRLIQSPHIQPALGNRRPLNDGQGDMKAAQTLGGGETPTPPRKGSATGTLEKLLTVAELAQLLKLNPKTVERMARAGRLPSLRVCGRVRFRPSDIASWLAAREDRACHGC
jgi:excisionase family DNA binding protein